MYCIFGKMCAIIVFSGLNRVSPLRGDVDVLLTAACEHLLGSFYHIPPPPSQHTKYVQYTLEE